MFDIAIRNGKVIDGTGNPWSHGLGLGTVIMGLLDHQKVEEILGVPQDVEVVAMTPLGYPAAWGSIRVRKDSSDFVFDEKYSKSR